MKSIKPSPFDWNTKKSTLFTTTEKANMKSFAVAKSIERKEMKTFSRAGAK
jgi:hypothetical protein